MATAFALPTSSATMAIGSSVSSHERSANTSGRSTTRGASSRGTTRVASPSAGQHQHREPLERHRLVAGEVRQVRPDRQQHRVDVELRHAGAGPVDPVGERATCRRPSARSAAGRRPSAARSSRRRRRSGRPANTVHVSMPVALRAARGAARRSPPAVPSSEERRLERLVDREVASSPHCRRARPAAARAIVGDADELHERLAARAARAGRAASARTHAEPLGDGRRRVKWVRRRCRRRAPRSPVSPSDVGVASRRRACTPRAPPPTRIGTGVRRHRRDPMLREVRVRPCVGDRLARAAALAARRPTPRAARSAPPAAAAAGRSASCSSSACPAPMPEREPAARQLAAAAPPRWPAPPDAAARCSAPSSRAATRSVTAAAAASATQRATACPASRWSATLISSSPAASTPAAPVGASVGRRRATEARHRRARGRMQPSVERRQAVDALGVLLGPVLRAGRRRPCGRPTAGASGAPRGSP